MEFTIYLTGFVGWFRKPFFARASVGIVKQLNKTPSN